MKDQLRAYWTFGDHLATTVTFALVVLGLVMVHSATFGTRYAPLAGRQLLWAVLSSGVFLLAVLVPYELWVEYGYILYGFAVAALVAVLVFGHTVSGSKSWLTVGPVGFQPSEFAKVAVILAAAAYLKGRMGKDLGPKDVVVVTGLAALPAALTFLQPDFGTTTTFLPLAAAGLFFSNLPLARILKWAAIGSVVVLLLFGLAWLTVFKPYQKERLLTFANPSLDPRGAGYQVSQARIAVGSGQLTGKGLYSGTQNRLNFLPAPHTDFIFGVVAEETGFVGSALVLGAFLVLLLRLLRTISAARDPEGRFLVLAVFALLLYHIVINVGMVLGLLPTTGIPLPFLSYGGSFLVTMSLSVGLAVNVYTRRFAP